MIDSRSMAFHKTVCVGCGQDGGSVVLTGTDRLHGGPGVFRVLRCPRCGHMRTDPVPSRASMAEYYPADYQPYVGTAVLPGRLRLAVRRMVTGEDTPVPPVSPGKLLEIGAASGNFLVEMQKRGWSVVGLEWDAHSARRAADRTGARVIAADLADVSLPGNEYDLICAWMVFEHVEDPRAAFERCFRWLRPGGWLAFSVPDCGGWQFRVFGSDWHALQLPTHLHHFTVPVLRSWLSSAGYVTTKVRWQTTLFDVPMSLAYMAESLLGARFGRIARTVAGSAPVRLASRLIGRPAAAAGLTGRVTVWAQKPC